MIEVYVNEWMTAKPMRCHSQVNTTTASLYERCAQVPGLVGPKAIGLAGLITQTDRTSSLCCWPRFAVC